jgi:hypothetical protein
MGFGTHKRAARERVTGLDLENLAVGRCRTKAPCWSAPVRLVNEPPRPQSPHDTLQESDTCRGDVRAEAGVGQCWSKDRR